MLDGLAFLPLDDVLEGLAYLRDNTPEGLESLIDYFDSTYVSGGYRRIQPPPHPDGSVPSIRVRRMPPTYEPSIWNVHDITLAGGSRTNNICEGWNNAFMKLVGHAHPTIWRAIDSLRKDQTLRRHTVTLQAKLHKLCTDRSQDMKTIPELLRGVGHCIRWK